MSEPKGTTVVVPERDDRDEYRPKASTATVEETIIRALGDVVGEATYHAGMYVSLARHYDRDEGTAVRYGHLVDASECLEIAMTYLDTLKTAVSHRLRVEDDGPCPF